jgi:nitroreductase
MELQKAIFERRTVRSFLDKPVSFEIIKELIGAAIYAPSACNQQAWKFILIESSDLKEEICINYGSPFISQSPSGILVLYRNDVSLNYRMYKDHIQSSSAAIQNILLTAFEKGLGACWICDLPSPQHIRKVLNIPRCYEVIAYIALGYPKKYLSSDTIRHYDGDVEKTRIRERKYSVEEVLSLNKFDDSFDEKQIKKYLFVKSSILHIITKVKHNKLLRKLIKV